MIIVFNGSLVQTTASDEDIVPHAVDSNGNIKPVGRHEFMLSWVSGTVKTLVGASTTSPPSGITPRTDTAAANWIMTASPIVGDGMPGNIHASGGGTFNITW